MATRSERIQVTDEPFGLSSTDFGDQVLGKSVTIRNRSNASIDIGGADVVSGEGFELDPGDEFGIELEPGEAIYLIGPDAGPNRVDVLWTGVAE